MTYTYHATHVLLYEIGIFLHSLTDATEDDTDLGKLLSERRGNRDRIKNGINGNIR